MNLTAILVVVVMWGASLGGSYFYGQSVGKDSEIAGQAKINQAIRDTREAAQQGAADAIAANKPINQTIVQKAQTIVRENTVYRDCRNPPDGLRSINAALTGDTTEPTSGVVVPKADAAKR